MQIKPEKHKQRRGFALMRIERRREVAANGGRTSHAHGTANRFTHETSLIANEKKKRLFLQKQKREEEMTELNVKN